MLLRYSYLLHHQNTHTHSLTNVFMCIETGVVGSEMCRMHRRRVLATSLRVQMHSCVFSRTTTSRTHGQSSALQQICVHWSLVVCACVRVCACLCVSVGVCVELHEKGVVIAALFIVHCLFLAIAFGSLKTRTRSTHAKHKHIPCAVTALHDDQCATNGANVTPRHPRLHRCTHSSKREQAGRVAMARWPWPATPACRVARAARRCTCRRSAAAAGRPARGVRG